MSTGIPVIYDNGVFRPLGPIDLPDQAAVVVVPTTPLPSTPGDGIRRSAGAWADAGPDFDDWLSELHNRRSMPRGTSEGEAGAT